MPLLVLLAACVAGCGAGDKPKPPSPGTVPPRQAAPAPKRRLPAAKDLGPAMDAKRWKIQCQDADLAMMCRRSDPTDRRCASRQGGRYRWTYGSFCASALPCYRRACPD